MIHVAALGATSAARTAGHADSDDAIRLRMKLDAVVTATRERQVELAKAMAHDLAGRSRPHRPWKA